MMAARYEVVHAEQRGSSSVRPSGAILNLRRRRAERMARQVARHRLRVRRDVESSVGDTPAFGQHVMLRTSCRTPARRQAPRRRIRIAVSTSWSFTKWNWMFCAW